MASKECGNDAAKKKVVVVKSNDFFPVQKIHFRQQIQHLDDLAPDISFISKVYKPPSRITSCTETSTSSQRSLLKQPPQKHVVHKMQTTPIRKYRRKVSVIDEGLEKTKFVEFARLSTATNFAEIKKTAESETVDVTDLNEEEVIDLVNEKYGDAIEAQIKNKVEDDNTISYIENSPKCQRGIKIIRDSSQLLPSNVHEYKWREEQFIDQINKEQSTKDEVREVQKYLESIIILDSPEKGNKLFTREELKKLPDKIFESPPEIVKTEVFPPEQENLSETNLNKLVNSQMDTIQNRQSFESGTTNEATDKVKLEVDDNMWELDLKDIDFHVLTEQTNPENILCDQKESCPENAIRGKEISIADEDAIIFKEMDKFIAEIKNKNNSQPLENSVDKFSGITVENKVNNYCLEYTDINQNTLRTEQPNEGILENVSKSKAFECSETEKMQKIADETETLSILNEIIKSAEIVTQKQDTCVVPSKTVPFNESAINNDEISMITKKCDVLEKLVLESGIQNKEELEKTKPSENLNVTTGTTAETPENYDKINLDGHNNDNSTQNSSSNKTYDRHNSNEYTVLIIKEDGSVEPINIDNIASSVKPYIPSAQAADSQFIQTENCVLALENAENERNNSQINKGEFLALIEKVKAVQYDPNLNSGKTEQEKLKNFNSSLKEHIKILKEIYAKLEVITELTTEKLNVNLEKDQICGLRDDLNFVKSVIENISAKEEKKKLKYKVVSVTKKSATQTKITSKKPVAKKVNKKPTTKIVRKYPNKLLRKTLYRTNKLLDIFERNQNLVNIRQNAFVSKLKEMAKNDLNKQTQEKTSPENKSDKTIIDKEKQIKEIASFESDKITKSNAHDSGVLTTTNSKKSVEELDVNNKKVVSVVLNRSNITEVDIENFNQNLSQEELSSSLCYYDFDRDDEGSYEVKKSSAEAGCIKKTKDKDDREENVKVQCKEDKKRSLRNRESSSRYSFRPRTSKTNYSSDWYKEALLDKMEKAQSYQVDYTKVTLLDKKENQNFDYLLKDDKQPCVVSYDKEPALNKLIFEKPTPQPQRKSSIGNFKKGDNNDDKENNVVNRYETRSKTVEKKMVESQRTLRSRRV